MRKSFIIILVLSLAFPAFAAEQAKRVTTSTTNFNDGLSTADTTVQKALDTLDDAATNGAWDKFCIDSDADTCWYKTDDSTAVMTINDYVAVKMVRTASAYHLLLDDGSGGYKLLLDDGSGGYFLIIQ